MKEYSLDKRNELIKTKKFIYETIKGYDIVSEISVLMLKGSIALKLLLKILL